MEGKKGVLFVICDIFHGIVGGWWRYWKEKRVRAEGKKGVLYVICDIFHGVMGVVVEMEKKDLSTNLIYFSPVLKRGQEFYLLQH